MGSWDDDDHQPFSREDDPEIEAKEEDNMNPTSAADLGPYLRLNDHIEHLHADQRPPQPEPLAPDDARAYQMAALFRAASPGATDPDPDFVARLQARLEHEMDAGRGRRVLRAARQRVSAQVSRRGLLAGGLGAAAAVVVGAVGGAAIEQHASSPETTMQPSGPLVPAGVGAWVAVAAATEVPLGAVKRFATESIVGFVRHTADGFVALSGTCTHMGCLLNWNGSARTFDCPCHGGRFTETGTSAPTSPVSYRPLPPIAVKVEGGQIMVYVPAPSAGGGPYNAAPAVGRYGD